MRKLLEHILPAIIIMVSLGACSSKPKGVSPITVPLNSSWSFSRDSLTGPDLSSVENINLPYLSESDSIAWFSTQFIMPDDSTKSSVYLVYRCNSSETSLWVNSMKVSSTSVTENLKVASLSGFLNPYGEKNTLTIKLSGAVSDTLSLSEATIMAKGPLHFTGIGYKIQEINQAGGLLNFTISTFNDSESQSRYTLDLVVYDSKGKQVGTARRNESISPIENRTVDLPVLVVGPSGNYTIEATLSDNSVALDVFRYDTQIDFTGNHNLEAQM